MAQCAVRAEPAFVQVVFAMAVNTLFRRVEKRMACMAVFADGFIMPAQQRETCQVMIETNIDIETRFVVAAGASLTQLRFMRIVIGMAVIAGSGRERGRDRLDMTVRTGELRMGAEQCELGIARMIEADIEPVGDPVAIVADLAVDAIVRIVFDMAPDAFGR